MRKRLSLWCALGASAFLACGGGPTATPDAGSGPGDAGPDAGNPVADAGPSDAGPVDGGTGDGGVSDGGLGDGGDAGAPDAGCPYAYCEDFEGYAAGPVASGELLGPWLATVQGRQVSMTIDASGGYGGSQALRVTVGFVPDGGAARATLNQHTDGGALVGADLFGRAEIFYATGGDAGLPLGVHSWLFNAAGRTPAGGLTSMNLGGGGAKAQLNYQYPRLPDGGHYLLPDGGDVYPTEASVQGGSVTAGAWHCLQWEYHGTPANVGDVWIDGVPAITVNDPTPATNWILSDAYDSFDLGFTHYQELSNGIDVYVDHFALDGQKIPCP